MVRASPVVDSRRAVTTVIVTAFAQIPSDIDNVGFDVVGVMFTSKRSNGS